jgi:hypothetical protein
MGAIDEEEVAGIIATVPHRCTFGIPMVFTSAAGGAILPRTCLQAARGRSVPRRIR